MPIKKLIEANLEEGSYRILFEDIIYHIWIPVSPQGDKFVFRRYTPVKEKAHLVLFDVQTSSTKDIFESKAFGVMRIKWNRDGNQILFSRKTEGLELWRYNLTDDTVKRIEFNSNAYFSKKIHLISPKMFTVVSLPYHEMFDNSKMTQAKEHLLSKTVKKTRGNGKGKLCLDKRREEY